MKTIKNLVFLAIAFAVLNASAQEKKIKFSKGTLKICSSKNFQIEGYDGNEVIVKSLHDSRKMNFAVIPRSNSNKIFSFNGFAKNAKTKKKMESYKSKVSLYSNVKGKTKLNNLGIDSTKNEVIFLNNDNITRKKGLKKLGKKNENSDLGIYFTIEQKGDELLFKDNSEGQLVMMSNEKYLIKIPNSIKLNWQTNACINNNTKGRHYSFFTSDVSSLSNFDGEVEISSSLNNTKLVDVTGPVSINTIGGNVTIEFDKKVPQKLYSIYSNNGFIDITLPNKSDVRLDATANDIFSDIDFKVEEENDDNNVQHMKLKLKSGKVKIKLNAGLGNIYLRKGK